MASETKRDSKEFWKIREWEYNGVTHSNREQVLSFMFPRLRRWWEMCAFEETFSQEDCSAYAAKHRIAELLTAIESVEAGKAPASTLQEFSPVTPPD